MRVRFLGFALLVIGFLSFFSFGLSALASEEKGGGEEVKFVTENLDRLYEAGILKGYPGGQFHGERQLTRYEMGAVITRFYGHCLDELNKRGVEVCDFVDIRIPVTGPMDMTGIPRNHWAYDEILRLEHMGVASGYPGGEYGGTKYVNRYEFAAALLRMVVMVDFAMWEALPKYRSGLRHSGRANVDNFTDVPADHWALKDIQRLCEAGIDIDSGGSEFRGDETMTRYQMAAVLLRLLDRFEHEVEVATSSE